MGGGGIKKTEAMWNDFLKTKKKKKNQNGRHFVELFSGNAIRTYKGDLLSLEIKKASRRSTSVRSERAWGRGKATDRWG